ncbi:MAG: polyphosphate:AMP phosphotransferase [Pseudomonadales bacterium]|jgi:polyphosphate:AMP phosphotransferase|nr:polyphosphate:AMP phosphotransferase [Pseudomonadales bacterium]
MFAALEQGATLSKDEFEAREPELRVRLLQAQRRLQGTRHGVVILVSGVETAGKSQVVNRLNEWFDTHGIETHAFWNESDEETSRPPFWRYWRALPPRGRIALMFGSWYTQPLLARMNGEGDQRRFTQALREIAAFERTLTQDGLILIKLWYHLPRHEIVARLRAEAQHPDLALRGIAWGKQHLRHFGHFLQQVEHTLRLTHDAQAPWHLIDASDARHRDFTTGQVIAKELERHIKNAKNEPAPPPKRARGKRPANALDTLPLDRKLAPALYDAQLQYWQRELYQLSWRAYQNKQSTILAFEGWDAAGKGGVIRRLTHAMDARLYQVNAISEPSDEELARHYLWRFWRRVPRAGYFGIFDRSWYGRVLVERVEGLASEAQWRRAYDEINLFERELCENGILLLKFWLHISPEEQLRRFHERERTPWKHHKIGPDDWRNRSKWRDYEAAVADMLHHTNTRKAPWRLIAANDKKYARITVLKTVCQQLRKLLEN